ncbi:hypothetical protein [Corynebacterium terpenotabidum]|uniref:hypothetical protein n=1 Tax=Corynebacterium terpenotabidum TaxID=89154 RepID=UPI0004050625|nr:hypothetical protein [Corynebacterium terpenotabidum]
MKSRLRRTAVAFTTALLVTGLGSSMTTASAATQDFKWSASSALGCSGTMNYFWCR